MADPPPPSMSSVKARTWPVPEPLDGNLSDLTLRIEARTGLRIETGLAISRLSSPAWQERLEQLARLDPSAAGPDTDPAWHEPTGFEGVRQSLVMAREFAPGDTRLVAYVAADELDDQSIRSYLSRKLPEYMIPSAFVRMDSLPLTSNGRVDRSQLPDAIPSRPSSDSAQIENGPIDETTLSMLRLWLELFPGREVGIRDNFFDLGGHSLMATRLLARVEEVFGFAPSLVSLAREPTVERFSATLCLKTATEQTSSQLVPLSQPGQDVGPPFICFPGGAGRNERIMGSELSLVPLAQAIGADYPLYVVSLDDPPSGQSFAEVLPAYAERNPHRSPIEPPSRTLPPRRVFDRWPRRP